MLLPARKFSKTASSFRTFPWKLFTRFIAGQLVVTVLLLAVAGVSARFIFRSWFLGQASAQVRATLQSLSRDLKGDLSEWCAGHSGGGLTFSVLRLNDQQPLCSTIGAEIVMGNADLRMAAENPADRFGAWLTRDRGRKTPVLLAAIDLPARGLTLRAALALPQLGEALRFFDRSLALVLLLVTTAFTGCSVFMGRRLMFPLGRLIVKARRVLPERPEGAGHPSAGPDESEFAEAADSTEGEWTDLETTLDQIRWDLRHKTETLTREREELATLMSAISDAILAVDLAGNPLFYNSRFALLFGERDLAARRPRLGELFRSPEVLSAFGAALRDGHAQHASAKLHVSKEPLPRYFSLSIAPLRKDGDEVYGAVGIFHDVTELKRAEQIRIDFVANVSHELRTPLTSIKGYTDTLRADLKSGGSESSEKFLEVIARNVDRLMSLIGDLLDLSSLESGNEAVTKAPVDTKEVTGRILGQLESIRARKGHVIETRFDAPSVLAQANRVEQVLTNLLENAIKYVPAGGKIQVRWEKADRWLLLRIADSGPGIPHEHQARLFERFYRIDKARSRELGGTGLGLAIVKHIMQVHGGSVYVMSEPGKGTEFVCQFPA